MTLNGTLSHHALPQATAHVIAADQKAAADAFFAVQRQQMAGGGLPSPTSPLASAVVRGIAKAITQVGGFSIQLGSPCTPPPHLPVVQNPPQGQECH